MRLPPLNALRAFEAAARHGGFIPASEELHVTRGAISRHVKLLEEHLDVELFRRHARGVELTDAGRQFQPVLTEAFGRISQEATRLAADASELRILCPPATSIRWLIPKMEAFRAVHPAIKIRLTTDFHNNHRYDLRDYDLTFSLMEYPRDSQGLVAEPLFPVLISPACIPDLAKRIARPEDLSAHTLLHETPDRHDWRAWLSKNPVAGLDARSDGNDFPNLDLATRAALMGAGLVMADLVLCREELLSGALVLPFPDLVCDAPFGSICLLGREDTWHSSKVSAFRSWAVEAAKADQADLEASGISAPR